MIRRKIVISGLLCLVCGTMLVSCRPAKQGEVSSDAFTASMAADVHPIDKMKVSAKMDESSQIRISWDSVSRASSYVVYRSEDGTKWERLKKLVSDQTSYVDTAVTMGMDYHYKVIAACEYSQTDHFAYSRDQMPDTLEAECEIYTGVGSAYWDTETMKQKQQKIGRILLSYSFGAEGREAAEPEGVEIYRGTSKDHMKLLERGLVKDISTQEFDFGTSYVDDTVEQGRSYFYQVRAYAVINGTRVYGKRSDRIRVQAAEPDGVYSLRLVREPGSYRSNIVVALTSSKQQNGTLTLSSDILAGKMTMMYRMAQDRYDLQQLASSSTAGREAAKMKLKSPYQALTLKTDRYSTDGRYFQSVTGDIVIAPQQTVYLEMSPVDSTQQLHASADLSTEEITFQARYNEGNHLMKLDLKSQKAALEELCADGGFQIWAASGAKEQNASLRIGILSRYSGNKKLTLSAEEMNSLAYTYQQKNDDQLSTMTLTAEKYSTDGVKWKAISQDLTLKACDVLYLQFGSGDEQGSIPYRKKGLRHADLELSGVYGKNTSWKLKMNLLKETTEDVSTQQ